MNADMKNEKIRKMYDEYGKENDFEIHFFENPSFDNSIVAITNDGKLIYDYGKMICEFAQDNDCDPLEAEEFIDYNTMRALPYFGSDAPMILYGTTENLMMMYDFDETDEKKQ